MRTLTDSEIAYRAQLVYDSDLLCACGADPERGIEDPRWIIRLSEVICPGCLRESEYDPEAAWEREQL